MYECRQVLSADLTHTRSHAEFSLRLYFPLSVFLYVTATRGQRHYDLHFFDLRVYDIRLPAYEITYMPYAI